MPMKKESLGFGGGRTGRFTIGFNSDGFRFRAQVEGQDGIFRTAAVSVNGGVIMDRAGG